MRVGDGAWRAGRMVGFARTGRPLPLIEAREITLYRAGSPVFRPVSLSLDAGQCAVVTGPNGSGKTTLLRLLAGIVRPGEGTLDGGSRAFVGHRAGLTGDLTCRENLNFQQRFCGRPATGRVDTVMARVGLAGLGLRPAARLSAGQRRRLALARLLLNRYAVWLLDEPYASLDAGGIEMVDDLVEELCGGGRTVVVASHRWGRSLRAADRVAALDAGRLVGVGPPEEHAPPDAAPVGKGA